MVTTKATKVLALLLVAVTALGITGVALAQSFTPMNGYGYFSDSDMTPAGNIGHGGCYGYGGYGHGGMHGYWRGNGAMLGSSQAFVDADGDGICDYAGHNRELVDLDGDGIPDNPGLMHGFDQCAEFIDEDGDGICDNSGQQHAFIDEDGDGICDYAGHNR